MKVKAVGHVVPVFGCGQSSTNNIENLKIMKIPKFNGVAYTRSSGIADKGVSFVRNRIKGKDIYIKGYEKQLNKSAEKDALYESANEKRMVASGLLAGLVFVTGYLICRRGV